MIINNQIVEAKYLCECVERKQILVLNTTMFGVGFVYISNSDIYANIEDARIRIFDGLSYICFDRPVFLTWKKFKKIHLYTYEKLSYADYNRVVSTIHQFNTGDIKWSDTIKQFVYRDEYSKIKKSMKITISNISDNAISSFDHPAEADVVSVQSTTEELSDFNVGNITDDVYDTVAGMENVSDVDINPIVKMANEFDIPVKMDHNEVTGEDDALFDLVYSPNSKSKFDNDDDDDDDKVHPSKPRYRDNDRRTRYTRRWFSADEVKIIARMPSNSIASKYNCSATIATDMSRNARRIVGLSIASHIVTNRFTCYFNQGNTVDDVCKIYPDMSRWEIENNYKKWLINSNIKSNQLVLKKWESIINNNDTKTMIDYVFYNINDFATVEGCTTTMARDILTKIYNILSYNPLVCAGFGKDAFNEHNMWNLVNYLQESNKKSDKTALDVYSIVQRLSDSYRDSYPYHEDILCGTRDIPESVSTNDVDSFKSLIWNRFNRFNIITDKRELSDSQKYLLENGSASAIAKSFMISHERARSLIFRYRKKNS